MSSSSDLKMSELENQTLWNALSENLHKWMLSKGSIFNEANFMFDSSLNGFSYRATLELLCVEVLFFAVSLLWMLVIPKLALHEVTNYINQLYVWKNYI